MTDSRARVLGAAVLAGAALGALVLIVAELTTLYTIHVATARAAIRSEGTGSHNGYAMIPVAILALLLAAAVWSRNPPTRRIELLAIALLGVGALVLALAHDLSDAQAQGLVLIGGHYHLAKASPSAGLYMETLGAVVLIITGGCGLLMAGPPPRPARPPRPRPRPAHRNLDS
jgi:hypothetical protein